MNLCGISTSKILIVYLLVFSVFPIFVETARAQINYYWVTVNPTAPGLIAHSSVGYNWTVSFQATWTYGSNSGQVIENATVFIEVRTTSDTVVETLVPKTNTTGSILFYYSSQTPGILAFAPIKLVTEDGVEWNQSLLEDMPPIYGFQSKPITIYWDSFDISLISTDVTSLGVIRVSVNVTYLMIPEGGLTTPRLSNQSQYDYIPKYVHGADVEINGVRAEESSTPGLYTAETFTWLPTAYVLVEVSQEGWPQTHKAFSFAQSTNETIWAPAAILGLMCAAVPLAYHFFRFRKTKGHASSKKSELPFMGAILLLATSFISIYWAFVGIESTLHGFDWVLLGAFGLIAFGFGLLGTVLAIRRKNFVLTMIAVCLPMIENVAFVKYSLDNYQLVVPWMALALAFFISTPSAVLIGRSDEEFS
jgi:hypothetical protein